MIDQKEAINLIHIAYPDKKIKRCTKFKGDYIIQTDEEIFDPFFRVNGKTGDISAFSPVEDMSYFNYIK